MIVSAPEFIHETVLLKETAASVLNVTVAEQKQEPSKKPAPLSMRTFGAVGTADCC